MSIGKEYIQQSGTTASSLYHKVGIYKEYHSVCPLVGIGTLPTPLSPERRGGHTPLRLRGWGGPNSDDWKKLSTLPTLWSRLYGGLSLSRTKVE
jgi:hypothetical protein